MFSYSLYEITDITNIERSINVWLKYRNVSYDSSALISLKQLV